MNKLRTMDINEAQAIIESESLEGIAYSTKYGEYPDVKKVKMIVEALKVIHANLKGATSIDRGLASSLFIINDQVQGNMAGALSNGIDVPTIFIEKYFYEINDLLYAIFEDQ